MSKKADQEVKPEKKRACIYGMNGKYKDEPKRRAYVPKASQLLKVVDKYHGQPQIFKDGKWQNLPKKELRKLANAEKKARAEAKKVKKEETPKPESEIKEEK